jgi:cell wall-associated NlpC family hydrolase
VANSYGEVSAPNYDAYTYWTHFDQHPGDWNAPRGSLVFFDRNARNFSLGHVALCTGNGKIVEAGDYAIKASTIRDGNYNAPYLGWAWPPSYWLGRSDGSATAAFIINMDKFIKESIKSALFKLHIY